MQGSPEDPNWDYNQECLDILEVDLVSVRSAQPCSKWCAEHFGHRFPLNLQCAWGMMPNENSKPMPVLTACLKANVASTIHMLPSSFGYLLAAVVALLGIGIGTLRYRTGEVSDRAPKFESCDEKDGKISLAGIALADNVPRSTEERWKLVNMAGMSLLDTASDIASIYSFLKHGQPFYAMAQGLSVLFSNVLANDDVVNSTAVMWWIWGLTHGAIPLAIYRKKLGDGFEANCSLAVTGLCLITTPLQDNNGKQILAAMDAATYAFSFFSSAMTLRDTSEARFMLDRWNASHDRNRDDDDVGDADRLWVLSKERTSFLPASSDAARGIGRWVCLALCLKLSPSSLGAFVGFKVALVVFLLCRYLIERAACGKKHDDIYMGQMLLVPFIIESAQWTFECLIFWWHRGVVSALPWLPSSSSREVLFTSSLQASVLWVVALCQLWRPFGIVYSLIRSMNEVHTPYHLAEANPEGEE